MAAHSLSNARPTSDLFGRALVDWTKGRRDPEYFERDDGATFEGAGGPFYLADFVDWPKPERRAMQFVQGRVVDVGCGAGRVALHLQEKGHDVVAIDASQRAVRAAKHRGVEVARTMTFEELGDGISEFDTIVLFGNNFGILGAPEQCKSLLKRWARATKPNTRILAESINPYAGGAPAIDRSYYHWNKAQGRLPGSVTMRMHYRGMVGTWEDWLFVSFAEMQELIVGTGWRTKIVFRGPPSEEYVAVLEKAR